MAAAAAAMGSVVYNISSLTLPSAATASCGHVANLLAPLSDNEIDASNPAMMDIGLLALLGLFDQGQLLPPPLDRATASDLLSWWRSSLAADKPAATHFLKQVAGLCMAQACSSTSGIGEADIAGIGVTVANAMLAMLVVIFWCFGLTHSPGPAHGGVWSHDCFSVTADSATTRKEHFVKTICGALRGTIDDVFDGALVFSISLHVATLSYSSGQDGSRYEITFAQTSCTFAAMSVITLWHVRMEMARPRFPTQILFCVMCALSLAVFVMRALYWRHPTTFWDEACVSPESGAWWFGNRIMFDFFSTVYFGLALLTTFTPVDRLFSWLYPGREGRKEFLRRRGLVSKLRCAQSFLGTGGTFVYMVVMNQARSSFQDENTWSIGQYLAVATWVPSIAKMLYFLAAGMERSLTAHLPRPWIAVIPFRDSDEDGEEGDEEAAPQEAGVMTRRNTNQSTTSSRSGTGFDPLPPLPERFKSFLARRDSDMTVVGDAPEPAKLKG